VIPGKRPRLVTVRGLEGVRWMEFARASALLRETEERFPCSGILPDQDRSGMAFYRNQVKMTLRAQTFRQCE
jgi:hypothetical protein